MEWKIEKHGMENRKTWNGKSKNMEWKIEKHEVDQQKKFIHYKVFMFKKF